MAAIVNTDSVKKPHKNSTLSEFQGLKNTLPGGFQYKFVASEDEEQYPVVRVNISDEETAEKWKKQFEESTKTTWRLNNGKVAKGKVNIYKRNFRCHHNTHPRSSTADSRRGSKNCDCPALLTITVKRTEFKQRSRGSVDPHLPNFPGVVQFKNLHNHDLITADSLKERDISDEAKQKLLELFQNGHSPSSALEALKIDLEFSEGDNYVFAAADRAQLPDAGYCYRLYYQIFKKAYGAPSGEQMLKDLEKHIEQYNCQNNKELVKFKALDKDFIVTICTPLMQRVHELVEQSGELVFVDASGGVDRYHCRIFLILTHSCAGGLPLGVLITTSESTDVITAGLELLKEVLPDRAFYGRGQEGPAVFMTDDSTAERSAITNCFPDSVLLLCVFHVLQANWRYLWDAKHSIKKEDRPHLFSLLKEMVYAKDEEELSQKYDRAREDSVAQRYEGFLHHLQDTYDRRHSWAVSLREELPIRGNNTNNYVEAAMRVLKDKVFQRVKAFNVVQLLDFMLTRFEAYYMRRLIDVANNRLDGCMSISNRYMLKGDLKISKEEIKQFPNLIFSVPSETKKDVTYHVDMSMGLCSCYTGKTGGPCKHQAAIVKHFGIESVNFVPVTSAILRGRLYQVATGCTELPSGWFSSLRDAQQKQPAQVSLSSDDEEEVMPGASHDTNSLTGSTEPPEHPPSKDDWSLEQQRQLHNRFLSRHGGQPITDTNNSDMTDELMLNTLQQQIMQAATDICSRLEKNPQLTASAKKFVKMSNELVTDTALDSALACFGRYTGAGVAKASTKSRSTIKPRGSSIGVQPTAIARRKSDLGGRRCLITGRNTKESKCPIKRPSSECVGSLLPPKKPRKAPHNLAHCVMKNQSLGKTHSSKS